MVELIPNREAPVDETAPVLQFQYLYKHSFPAIAAAWVQKYNYEPRTHLTTTAGVQQLDENRVVFYRRADSVFSNELSYERVIIDRRGQITSELLRPRENCGERLFERGVIVPQGDEQTLHNHFVFDHQGIKSWKVEFFKQGVETLLKAIKFAQFDAQA